MSTESKRMRRVADVIQREVVLILQRQINDPRLQTLTVLSVNMSPDLKRADIFYTVRSEAQLKDIAAALVKASGYVRSELASRSTLKYVPKIYFTYDKTFEKAQQLTRLLDDIDVDLDTVNDCRVNAE